MFDVEPSNCTVEEPEELDSSSTEDEIDDSDDVGGNSTCSSGDDVDALLPTMEATGSWKLFADVELDGFPLT